MASRLGSFEFEKKWYLLLLGPIVVIVMSSILLAVFGYPLDHLAEASVRDGHKEAAGRLRMLTSWLLLSALSVAIVIYAFSDLRRLVSRHRFRFLLIYGVTGGAGCLILFFTGIEASYRMLDQRVVCAAFEEMGRPDATAPGDSSAGGATARPRLKDYGQPSPRFGETPPPCTASQGFPLLRWANDSQKYVLALLIPALVLGTISCLALPRRPSIEDCRLQVQRLSTYLYMTATVFVAGLLFLSALLNWPAFAFTPATAASYAAHVNAYVLYWGIAYTILIGSYYVPVALILSRNCAEARQRTAGAGKPDGLDSPASELSDLMKALVALFAPAITGLLGGLISL